MRTNTHATPCHTCGCTSSTNFTQQSDTPELFTNNIERALHSHNFNRNAAVDIILYGVAIAIDSRSAHLLPVAKGAHLLHHHTRSQPQISLKLYQTGNLTLACDVCLTVRSCKLSGSRTDASTLASKRVFRLWFAADIQRILFVVQYMHAIASTLRLGKNGVRAYECAV